jgi:N-dimethylarginine dimethylaminohydrolase
MAHGINIYSEIGKLNRVMLHRMGLELEALVPDNFERLLFDEIPYLKVAQYEHDCFANVLKENGIKVHYFTDEVAKSIKNENIRKKFVKEFIRDSDVHSNYIAETIEQYLLKLPLETMVDTIIAGIKKADLKINKIDSLGDFVNKDYPYYTDPMPNLYFMRDPGTFIGNTVNINCMKSKARKRESLMFKYISLYNKELVPEGTDINVFEGGNFIEGGDILVLSEEIIAVGISQRTSAYAIETLRGQLLDALLIAILSSIAFSIIGLEFAVFLGSFAGICNIIPYFGPIISIIPAALVGLITEGLSQAFFATLAMIIVQQIDANILYPRIVGSTVGLHPLFVLISVTVGGYYAGILGMVLAVPIAGIIKVLLMKKLDLLH